MGDTGKAIQQSPQALKSKQETLSLFQQGLPNKISTRAHTLKRLALPPKQPTTEPYRTELTAPQAKSQAA